MNVNNISFKPIGILNRYEAEQRRNELIEKNGVNNVEINQLNNALTHHYGIVEIDGLYKVNCQKYRLPGGGGVCSRSKGNQDESLDNQIDLINNDDMPPITNKITDPNLYSMIADYLWIYDAFTLMSTSKTMMANTKDKVQLMLYERINDILSKAKDPNYYLRISDSYFEVAISIENERGNVEKVKSIIESYKEEAERWNNLSCPQTFKRISIMQKNNNNINEAIDFANKITNNHNKYSYLMPIFNTLSNKYKLINNRTNFVEGAQDINKNIFKHSNIYLTLLKFLSINDALKLMSTCKTIREEAQYSFQVILCQRINDIFSSLKKAAMSIQGSPDCKYKALIALIKYEKSNVENAKKILTEAENVAQSIQNNDSRYKAFKDIAIAYAKIGDSECIKKAKKLVNSIGCLCILCEALVEIAVIRHKQGNRYDAKEFLNKAEEISKVKTPVHQGALDLRFKVLKDIAIAYAKIGDRKKAKEIAVNIRDDNSMGACFSFVSYICPQWALKDQNYQTFCEVLREIGVIEYKQCNSDDAKGFLNEAREATNSIVSNHKKRRVLKDIAITYAEMNDIEEGVKTVDRMHNDYKSETLTKTLTDIATIAYTDIATIAYKNGNFEKAKEILEKAKEAVDRVKCFYSQYKAFQHIALTEYKLGIDEAEKTLEKAKEAVKNIQRHYPDSKLFVFASIEIGRIEYEKGYAEKAKDSFDMAKEFIEQIQEEVYLKSHLRERILLQEATGEAIETWEEIASSFSSTYQRHYYLIAVVKKLINMYKNINIANGFLVE